MNPRRRFAMLLAMLAVCLSATSIAAAEDDEEEPADKTVTLKQGDHVLFFGDSLTALALEEEGYVTLARQALAESHPDLDLKVSAVATGGHTVPDLLARLEQDVLPQKPTIVFIQIGVNDARRFTADEFRANLLELIGKLRDAGIQVVLCSCTSLGEKHDGSNPIDDKLDAFADVARDIAREQKLPLNDLRKAFVEHWKEHNPENKDRDILTYDGNHFNAAGHRFVADRMLSKLK